MIQACFISHFSHLRLVYSYNNSYEEEDSKRPGVYVAQFKGSNSLLYSFPLAASAKLKTTR